MININEILRRNGIGESLGIKIKDTKSYGESYKKLTKCKSLAIAGETKAIKNSINGVIKDQIQARGESSNIKVEDDLRIKSYKDIKRENGLIPRSEKFFGLGRDTVIKCLGHTREQVRSIMKKEYGKPRIAGDKDIFNNGDIVIRYDKEDYTAGIDIFKGEFQNFSKRDKLIIGEPEEEFEKRMNKLFGRTLLDKGNGVYYERSRDCTIRCKGGKVHSVTFNYDRKKIEEERRRRAREYEQRLNNLANIKYIYS